MAAPVIQFKRGLFSNLPGLRVGEPGFTTDKYDLYVGIDSTTSGNKFFGSHRYWTKETASAGSGVNLVEGTNNGENAITLKSPDSLASSLTYTFPGTIVTDGFLKVAADGSLEWDDTVPATDVNVAGVGTVAFLQSTTVNVSAGATVGGALDVDGGATVDGGLEVTGQTTVNDHLNVVGTTTSANLTVSGTSLFQGGVQADSIILANGGVSGNLTGNVTGNVTSTGSNSFGQVSVSGVTTSTGGFVGDLTGNVTGDVTGDLTGNADTATALETARDFSASGDASASAVSFDGTGNVDLALTLATVNSDTGSFGSQTQIPVVTVNAKGLVTAVTTASVGTALTVTGDSGTEQIDLLSEELAITGGANVTTNAASNGVEVALDDNISLVNVNASGIVTASSFTGDGANISNIAYSNITNAQSNVRGEFSATSSDFGRLTYNSSTGEFAVAGVTTSEIRDQFSASATGFGRLTYNSASGEFAVAGVTTSEIRDQFTAGTGVAISSGEVSIGQPVATTDSVTFGQVNVTGVVSATSFATGAEGSAIVITSDTITGPSSITLDPSALNDNTGTVYILGDLQVKGTQTIVDSTTVQVADLAIEVAKDAANDAAANGGGLTVQSGEGNKTWHFEALGDNFGSSENINLASGKVFKINNSEVLSATALDSGVVVDLASLDIDGGTAATEVTADDLFIIDDGAGGTNKKVTAQLISDYVLGGSGGATFSNVNVTGIATVNQFNAADADITGIATASEFRGSDFRDVDGSLVPLVGVSSNLAHTGLVTAFKFYGTGLEEYIVEDEIASIKISGVAASTYTTSQTVTATQGQTAFTFSAGYEDGFLDAYLNGIRLVPGVDFSTAANNTSVNLISGATAGDELEMVAYKSLGDIYSLNQLQVANSLTVAGVVTANSFNGALNFTGVSTAGQVQAIDLNATGIVTATGGFVGDVTGNVTGDLTGNADTATALETARDFSASGDASASAVSFDGTGNVDLALTLATVNSDTGSFGSQTEIPVVTVNAKGLVTAVTTASVGTALTVTSDTGSEDINLLTESLAITGGSNITGTASANGVELALDDNITLTSVTADLTGDVTGNADTATALETARNFSASGDASASAVSFDGTGNVDLGLTLATVNSNVGSFGSQTQIPVVTVNAKGLVTAVSTASVGTSLDVTGDSGSEQIDLLTEALAITGGSNVTTSAASNGVEVALDNDISVTSVTTQTLNVSGISTQTGNANFGANVTIAGDLTVNGTTTQINTTNTTIEDTLLELQRVDGGSLTSDTNKDVGLVLNYFDGSAKKAAIYWDDSASRFALTGDASESSGVLTAASYASLEVGGLFLNDCAGASQVISCSGTTRSLENITIDGGTF